MKKFVLLILLSVAALAVSLDDFIDKSKCDQVIDKQLYEICYSYKHKGALAGWVTLHGDKVNSGNIKKRPRFYNEKNIPMKYRTKYKDYTGYGKDWNRGHYNAPKIPNTHSPKLIFQPDTIDTINQGMESQTMERTS